MSSGELGTRCIQALVTLLFKQPHDMHPGNIFAIFPQLPGHFVRMRVTETVSCSFQEVWYIGYEEDIPCAIVGVWSRMFLHTQEAYID